MQASGNGDPLEELPLRLRQNLEERGVDEEEILRALADNTLHFLAVDLLLGRSGGEISLEELSDQTGMEPSLLTTIWRALGLTQPEGGEPIFTPLDVEAARLFGGLVAGGTGVDVAIQLSRVIGSSMARIAEAEVVSSALAITGDVSASTADSDVEIADRFSQFVVNTTSAVPQLLGYVWLRHIHAAATRLMLARDRGAFEASELEVAIGFIDLVGFTVLSQQLSTEELSRIVSRFEILAYDTVTSLGGRVVKTIGDEVMFVVDKPDRAAEICLTLKEQYAKQKALSEVRAGVSFGKVLLRDGDYYGNVVNLAARMVNIADRGSILVSDAFYGSLKGSRHYVLKPLPSRYVKDLGYVKLWSLDRSFEDEVG